MGKIILVTGGSRSGKSAYAQRRAEEIPGRKIFIATCPVLDAELAERVRRHQAARAGRDWDTVEEQLSPARCLRQQSGYPAALLDCLTLWVNNLLYQAGKDGRDFTEDDMSIAAAELADAAREYPGTAIFVTNEVGLGLVPENALARRFRDLAGRCNQIMAARADEAVLLVSGLPLILKKSLA